MENQTYLGMNRTGIDMSPFDGKQLKEFAASQSPDPVSDGSKLIDERRDYARMAAPLGSVPLPGTVKGGLLTMAQKMADKKPEVFIDKLGERLAFERTGVRLYEALIAKLEAVNSTARQDFLDKAKHFRDEEAEHFALVVTALEKLGADPTAQTPCADAVAVVSAGPLKLINDPRANIAQSLNALLSMEFADSAGWELLIQLAQSNGQDEMAKSFSAALLAEKRHAETVKDQLACEVLAQQA